MKREQISEKTPVGRVSKPFGAAGGLVLTLYEGFPDDLRAPLWVVVDSLEVPLYADSFSRRGRTSAVVSFADIDTPRRALEMVGRELLLPRTAAPRQGGDELYLEDLAGYKAHLGGGITGVVEEFIDNGANPLFRITARGREVLVPAADELMERLDERRREVWFSLPEGLIDIND